MIAELDKQELMLALDRSKAALAQALARLGLDPSQENVTPDSTPAIRQAIAQMEDAKSKFDNASRLVKTGDISQERFTEIEKVYQSRQAALDAARDEPRTLIANVQALKAEVKLAQKRLNDATVRAPFDGAGRRRSCLSRRLPEREHAHPDSDENEPAAPPGGSAGVRRRLGAHRNDADLHHRRSARRQLSPRSFAS